MSLLLTLSTAVGAVILVAIMTDIIVTTLVPSGGAGPLTSWGSGLLWRVVLAMHRRWGTHRALRAAGPLIVASIIVLWVLGLIAGWALVFGREGALVVTESGDPTPAFGKIYFAAATILGRGATTYSPGSNLWQALEGIAAGTGVALVSLSIAYILPIISAVAHKREVASYIGSLGGAPAEILTRAWDGSGFGSLHLHFVALTPMVNRLAQNHLAYPVLHYFHSGERFTALGPSVVVLDETLTLTEEALKDERLLDPSSLRPCRAAIDGFLRTLTRVAVVSAEQPLPKPVMAAYRDAELPLRSDDEIEQRYEKLKDRRCLLAGFLQHDGWTEEETQSFDPDEWTDETTAPYRKQDDSRSEEERSQDEAATQDDTSAAQ